MKTPARLLLVPGLLAFAVFSAVLAAEKASPKGSIRPARELKPAEMVALAKITFADALKTALNVAPGAVVKAELEVEDGNLQYSFEIIGANRKSTEVEIDAGNGKVLATDKDEDEEKEDEAKEAKSEKKG